MLTAADEQPASHDNPAVFRPSILTNVSGPHGLRVEGPHGWSVTMQADGTTELTPPFGIDAGRYEVRFETTPVGQTAVRAEKVVFVTVGPPMLAGLSLNVTDDAEFNVPQHGTLAMTNYRIHIGNLGADADRFEVSITGLDAADFTLAVDGVDLASGESGIIGLALHPSGGLPPLGATTPFTVTASGVNSGLVEQVDLNFVYPAVRGLRLEVEPNSLVGKPGDILNAELVVNGLGNVLTPYDLSLLNPDGLTYNGLPSTGSIAAGATERIPLTIQIPSGTEPGIVSNMRLTADLCQGQDEADCSVPQPARRSATLSVAIGTAETQCVYESAASAGETDVFKLTNSVSLLAIELTRLQQQPDNQLQLRRAWTAGQALIDQLIELDLQADAQAVSDGLAGLQGGDPTAVIAVINSLDEAFCPLQTRLDALGDELDYGFDASLAPSGRIVAPGVPAEYTLNLRNTGEKVSTLNLSLANLPAGVAGSLSQTEVTLGPGEVIDETSATPITVTLQAATETTGPQSFEVAAQVDQAPSIDRRAYGVLAIVESVVDVLSLAPDPQILETAGALIPVTATLLNPVNQAREIKVAWRLLDDLGTPLFSAESPQITLPSGSEPVIVALGNLDTTGLPNGSYRLSAQVLNASGDPVPGRAGRGALIVGSPLSASVSLAPGQVTPGASATVVSKIILNANTSGGPGTAFASQFAKAVSSAAGVLNPDHSLGPPDHLTATVPAGGELVLDLGDGLDRVADGPGDDLVIVERQPGTCGVTTPTDFSVAVADDPNGPWSVLGTTGSDERRIGDGFDLAVAGIGTARYIRLVAGVTPIHVDGILAAHTASPAHIAAEYVAPLTDPRFDGISSTPVVGDLDRDGVPEIVVTTQTSRTQCEAVAIDGASKVEDLRITYRAGCTGVFSCFCGNTVSPALGDLDGDGDPELVLVQLQGELTAYEGDGTEIFRLFPTNSINNYSPALEDLDGDGRAELPWVGGYLEDDGSDGLQDSNLIEQPVAVDLDGDGTPELVHVRIFFSELTARRLDGTVLWSTSLGARSISQPAVADLSGDGRPELVVYVANSFGVDRALVALEADGNLLWRTELPDVPGRCKSNPTQTCALNSDCPNSVPGECAWADVGSQPSRPAIADLDGDGDPEIAVFVRSLDFSGDFYGDKVVAFDHAGSEIWRSDARDTGGGPPGVSAADLNGDGAAEVLWNGACSGFTVFSGDDGTIAYRDPRAISGSYFDHPVAADVDGDGHLEVATGSTDGLWIFGNDLGWANGRSVWNQADYRITNINDDLTLPSTADRSWESHNSYLAQAGVEGLLGDLSLTISHDLGVDFTPELGLITPSPVTTNGLVEWTIDFPASAIRELTVPGTIPALAAGDSVTVSDGTVIDGTLTTPLGINVPIHVELGPTFVYAPHLLTLSPDRASVLAGDAAIHA